jgi:hypothetical protein
MILTGRFSQTRWCWPQRKYARQVVVTNRVKFKIVAACDFSLQQATHIVTLPKHPMMIQ